MAKGIYAWSKTPADNANSDDNIIWSEGQDPSTVNNSSRQGMSEHAGFRDDLGAVALSTGTSTTYNVDSAEIIGTPNHKTIETLATGRVIWFRVHVTNTGTATLNVNTLGNQPLRITPGVELLAGQIVANQVIGAFYDGSQWLVIGANAGTVAYNQLDDNIKGQLVKVGFIRPQFEENTPAGWLVCDGSAVPITSYPALFEVFGIRYGGNGTTNFALPNVRGRVIRGVDETGTIDPDAAIRIPAFGGTATTPGSTQGDEFKSHSHGTTEANHSHGITDPGHGHGTTESAHSHVINITDAGHVHGTTDPGHTHGIVDPGHSHGTTESAHDHTINITDPGHTHPENVSSPPQASRASGGFDTVNSGQAGTTGSNTTGITADAVANTTGLSVNSNTTGIVTTQGKVTGQTVNTNTTGITAASVGQTTGLSVNSNTTGISVNGDVTGLTINIEGGNETRMKNIYAHWIVLADTALAAESGGPFVVILSGNGTPANSLGNNGDFYVDTTNDVWFGPKGEVTADEWEAGVSIIGDQGATGPAGPRGLTGLPYAFNSAIVMPTAPGQLPLGDIRFDNATYASVTQIAVSKFIDDGTGTTDVGEILNTFDDSSNNPAGRMSVFDNTTVGNFLSVFVDGISSQDTDYVIYNVTHISDGGTIVNDNKVSLNESSTGDQGDAGAVGPPGTNPGQVQQFNSNFTLNQDPGNGFFSLDNEANPTELYVDDLNQSASTIREWLDTWPSGTTVLDKGTLLIKDQANPDTVFKQFVIEGVVPGTGANTTYVKCDIQAGSLASAGIFADSDQFTLEFSKTGNVGSASGDVIGPNAGVVADEVALYLDTTGKEIKGSSLLVSDIALKSTYDANTIVKADADDTPVALPIATDALVGRSTPVDSGVITDLTPAEVRTMLNVEDAAAADQDATEVPYDPTGDAIITGTDVDAALADLDAVVGAIDATTVPYDPTGDNIILPGSTDVDAALADLDTYVYTNSLARNLAINPDFNVWQRNTNFVTVADGTRTADRWQYKKSTTATHNISRNTDRPAVSLSGHRSNYSLFVDCTVADAVVGAGDFVGLRYKIEGYDWQDIAHKTFTLSFWVKATKVGAGTLCIAFLNGGNDQTYIAEYTINTTNVWEYKTITVTPAPEAGTWNYINGVGLTVQFTLMAGTSHHQAADSWQANQAFSTVNQVNMCSSAANDFKICQVQIELGSIATPFNHNSAIADDVSRCQRYYFKTYHDTVFPGTISSAGQTQWRSTTVGANKTPVNVELPVLMRSDAPTVTVYSTGTGTAGQMDQAGTGDVPASVTITSGRTIGVQRTDNDVDGALYRLQLTAEAEI